MKNLEVYSDNNKPILIILRYYKYKLWIMSD